MGSVGILSQRVATTAENIPDRWLLHAGPGWGKTSLGAQFPKPIFLQSRGETGLQTLMRYGQLGEIPHLPPADTWAEVRQYIRALAEEDHDYKTVVVDTINGVETLMRGHVVDSEYNGSETAFMEYGKGEALLLTEWQRAFLAPLDALRVKRGMLILLLCHTKVKKFNNPTGPDYDRFTPDMAERLFAATYKWVDGAIFGAMETQLIGRTAKPNAKSKVSADVQSRVIYTEESAPWSAKNRHGLPPEIECGESPEDAYKNFTAALKTSKLTARARSEAQREKLEKLRETLKTQQPEAAPAEQNSGIDSGEQHPPVEQAGSFPAGQNQPTASGGPSVKSPDQITPTPAPVAVPDDVPPPVREIWTRMGTSKAAIVEELAGLHTSLVEQVGHEPGEKEYQSIVRQHAAGDVMRTIGITRRTVHQLWLRIEALKAEDAERREMLKQPPAGELFPVERAYAD